VAEASGGQGDAEAKLTSGRGETCRNEADRGEAVAMWVEAVCGLGVAERWQCEAEARARLDLNEVEARQGYFVSRRGSLVTEARPRPG